MGLKVSFWICFSECNDLTHSGVMMPRWCIVCHQPVSHVTQAVIQTLSLFPLLFSSVYCHRTQRNSMLWLRSSYGSVFRNMDLHYRSTLCCMDSHLTTVACAVCSHATIMQNSSITTLIFASGHWPTDGGALLFSSLTLGGTWLYKLLKACGWGRFLFLFFWQYSSRWLL